MWISLILFLSLASFSKISQVKIENGDKYVHFVLYLVLTVLLFYSRFLQTVNSKKVKILLSLLFSIVFGIIIELMQKELTVNRQFEWSDILANTCGSFVAAMFLHKFSEKNIFFK